MHNSIRYRDRAAECLLAAQEACQPYYRNIRLSMAVSWLSLARQDEAMDNLLTTGSPMLLARADEVIEQKERRMTAVSQSRCLEREVGPSA
jgi:hypothetical protein